MMSLTRASPGYSRGSGLRESSDEVVGEVVFVSHVICTHLPLIPPVAAEVFLICPLFHIDGSLQ